MIFSLIDVYFDQVSDLIGLPSDQLRIVFCWIVSIPLGFIMKYLNDPFIRNIYGLALGLFLQFLCIREYMYMTLASTIIVYVMAKILKKKCDWPTFFFLYGLLLACHIYRFYNDYYGWRIDGTSCLMVMLCKMTYFTFNYCDGKVEFPSLMDYLGYIYFFPSAIIGPVFSLQTYMKFIYLKEQYAAIPSSLKATMKQVSFGVAYLAALQIFEPYLKPDNVLYEDWYLNLNWFLKTLVWHPVIVWVQIRYLGAWKFAQAGMHACGISYSGPNKQTQEQEFNTIITVQDSYLLEYNPATVIQKWNKSVQEWLKDVFHTRLIKSFKPQQALLLVFTISGIWHGVHPMYFISFIHFAVYNDCAKFFYKAQDKLKFIPAPIRFVLKWYCGKTCINYFGFGFNLLEVSKVYELYGQVYYSFTILPILIHIFFSVTGYGQKSKKKPLAQQTDKPAASSPKTQEKKRL